MPIKEKTKSAVLIQQLLESSRDGILNWESTTNERVFQVSFPNYTIQVAELSHSSLSTLFTETSPTYAVRLFDSEGKLIEALEGESGIKDLYILARRKVLGFDQAVDSILDILSQEQRRKGIDGLVSTLMNPDESNESLQETANKFATFGPDAIESLIEILLQTDQRTRPYNYAREALIQFGSEAVAPLLTAIENEQNPRAKEKLKKVLTDITAREHGRLEKK